MRRAEIVPARDSKLRSSVKYYLGRRDLWEGAGLSASRLGEICDYLELSRDQDAIWAVSTLRGRLGVSVLIHEDHELRSFEMARQSPARRLEILAELNALSPVKDGDRTELKRELRELNLAHLHLHHARGLRGEHEYWKRVARKHARLDLTLAELILANPLIALSNDRRHTGDAAGSSPARAINERELDRLRHLMIYEVILGDGNPASPAAERLGELQVRGDHLSRILEMVSKPSHCFFFEHVQET